MRSNHLILEVKKASGIDGLALVEGHLLGGTLNQLLLCCCFRGKERRNLARCALSEGCTVSVCSNRRLSVVLAKVP